MHCINHQIPVIQTDHVGHIARHSECTLSPPVCLCWNSGFLLMSELQHVEATYSAIRVVQVICLDSFDYMAESQQPEQSACVVLLIA